MPAPGTIQPLTEEQRREMEAFVESRRQDTPEAVAFRRRMTDLAQHIAAGKQARGR